MRARAIVVVTVALCALSACRDTPQAAFERFYSAAANDDGARAFAELSPLSRAKLEQMAGNRERALQAVQVRSTLKALRVLNQNENDATLEVEDALGKKEQVRVVKSGTRWFVDLVGESMAASGAPASAPVDGGAP